MSLSTSIKCNLRASSSTSGRELQKRLEQLINTIASTKKGCSTPLFHVDDDKIKFGNQMEIKINIVPSNSFSFSNYFSSKPIRKPMLEKFSESPTGLYIEPHPDNNLDLVSIDVSHNNEGGNQFIRETVIPGSSRLYNYLYSSDKWISSDAIPSVFRYKSSKGLGIPPIRLIPDVRPTFIIYSENFDYLRNHLSDQFQIEDMVGGYVPQSNGSNQRERFFDLSNFYSFGFGVRFTNCNQLSKFFVHESDSVLENTIPSIQSARVMGGPSTLLENKYGYSGDCWSEVKAMGSSALKKAIWKTDK